MVFQVNLTVHHGKKKGKNQEARICEVWFQKGNEELVVLVGVLRNMVFRRKYPLVSRKGRGDLPVPLL